MKRNDIVTSYQDLVIVYKGKLTVLNQNLLNKQLCWPNLEEIREAHWLKLMIYEMIEESDNEAEIHSLGLDLTEIEYELQRLLKFKKDSAFHRFWEYPKCSCPKLDNMYNYPYRAIFNLSCLLHGV